MASDGQAANSGRIDHLGPRRGRRRVAPAPEVEKRLEDEYPQAGCTLDFTNPFELLVATVLSAQTTDAKVNTVTPQIFSRWPTPDKLAKADPNQLRVLLRTLGFHNRRSIQLIGLASKLCTNYQAQVPSVVEDLLTLPGVGRKTAHVVVGNCFNQPALTVDTHVGRLSRRLGWTKEKDPLAVEQDLSVLLTKQKWTVTCHRLIAHGRATCSARKPNCAQCVLADICPQWL